ncbi:EF-hand_domain pair [Hexamita inflata]|uniref:EF-hand_domain pair n=1 Tax=Hexamita inflata TaxID=28002 RepID=A0ABP1HQZ9_9EUKA
MKYNLDIESVRRSFHSIDITGQGTISVTQCSSQFTEVKIDIPSLKQLLSYMNEKTEITLDIFIKLSHILKNYSNQPYHLAFLVSDTDYALSLNSTQLKIAFKRLDIDVKMEILEDLCQALGENGRVDFATFSQLVAIL